MCTHLSEYGFDLGTAFLSNERVGKRDGNMMRTSTLSVSSFTREAVAEHEAWVRHYFSLCTIKGSSQIVEILQVNTLMAEKQNQHTSRLIFVGMLFKSSSTSAFSTNE